MIDRSNVTAEQLRSGGWWARPRTALGTCGWYPYAWTLTYGKTEQQAITNFINRHNVAVREFPNEGEQI
jgi:hypothetical protein